MLILIITMPVYAQENFALNINSGYLGIGGVFPGNDIDNTVASITLVNIGIEHIPTNIGLIFCPYANYDWINLGENSKDISSNYSFFNLKLYWNVLTAFDNLFYLGTFASVNYLFAGENVRWDKYVFTAGIHIGFRLSYERINYDLLSTEMGYRNINGTSAYFVGVKVDMLAFFLTLLSIWAESDD